jgi:hypothetical protein
MTIITRLLLIFLPICLAFSLQAQGYSIEGKLMDNDTEEPLESATIMLLHAADSSLVSFGRSNAEGLFAIRSVSLKDAYILRITYVGYELFDVEIPAEVTDKVYDVGTIRLQQVSVNLKEAVVKGQHHHLQRLRL